MVNTIEIQYEGTAYEFKTTRLSAYDSLLTLGKLGKVLAPIIANIDGAALVRMREQLGAGSADGEAPELDLSFIGLFEKVDTDLLLEVVFKLVSNASYNDVPVTVNDVAWKGKSLLLLKLAYKMAFEEYHDFLLELGLK